MNNTQIAIDLLNILEKTEAQRDYLLEVLEIVIDDLITKASFRNDESLGISEFNFALAKEAITKAKEEQ